jgi:hypothetical protein
MNVTTNSAEIAAQIRAVDPETNAKPRKRTLDALSNIIKACDSLQSVKAPITAASVAKETGGLRAGPVYGSIRNNARFMAYILARAAEQGISPKEKWDGPIVCKTGNPQFDADMNALHAHNRLLKDQVKSFARLLRTRAPYDFEAMIERGELITLEERTDSVSLDSRAAVAAIFDEKRLAGVGLKLSSTGEIESIRHPHVFLLKSEVDALRKLVSRPAEANPQGLKDASTAPEGNGKTKALR